MAVCTVIEAMLPDAVLPIRAAPLVAARAAVVTALAPLTRMAAVTRQETMSPIAHVVAVVPSIPLPALFAAALPATPTVRTSVLLPTILTISLVVPLSSVINV